MPGFVVQKTSVLMRSAKPVSVADEIATENGDLWDAIRPLNDAMNIAEGEQQYQASVAAFTKEQRAIHAAMWYASDVHNGGHWQFFYNSTGMLWEAAQRGLREIGASDSFLILSEAALRAGGSPPFELVSRQSLMKRLSPKFADLDEKFGKADPLARLRAYFSDNRAAFRVSDPRNA